MGKRCQGEVRYTGTFRRGSDGHDLFDAHCKKCGGRWEDAGNSTVCLLPVDKPPPVVPVNHWTLGTASGAKVEVWDSDPVRVGFQNEDPCDLPDLVEIVDRLSWVPVNDRLPPFGQRVLVVTKYTVGAVQIAYLDADEWWDFDDRDGVHHGDTASGAPTHWRTLPSLPPSGS